MLICASIRNFIVLSKYFDQKKRKIGFKTRIFSVKSVILHKNDGFDLAFDENLKNFFRQHLDKSYIYMVKYQGLTHEEAKGCYGASLLWYS